MRLTWGRFTKGSIYAIVDRMTLTFDLLTWKWFVTHGSLMGCISCTYAANPSSNRRAMAQTWWWWKGVVFNCFITYCSYQNNVRVNWSPSQINILHSTLTGGRGGDHSTTGSKYYITLATGCANSKAIIQRSTSKPQTGVVTSVSYVLSLHSKVIL